MSGAHVILRRGDLLWGLPADGVRGVEPLDRGASGVRVRRVLAVSRTGLRRLATS